MYDGINLQSGIYFIVIFIYVSLYTSIFLLLSLLIIPLLTYLILNFKNKVFLGDSGVYLVSFIISYSIVKTYNIDLTFTADQIFLIMMLPGIELLKQHDQQHLQEGFRLAAKFSSRYAEKE